MRAGRSIATFASALTAFVAIGAGVALLLPTGHDGAAVRLADAATATADSGEPPAVAPEPADGGFRLVAGEAAIPRPDSPSRIVIGSIALDAKVTEVGLTLEKGKPVWETAAFAVGYHQGTAQPGTRGNTVMAGHISSPISKKGEVFKRLPEVRIGDRVEIFVGERRVVYQVAEVKVVAPTAVEVMRPTEDATLTLITCYPNYEYGKRLIVVGKLVDGAT